MTCRICSIDSLAVRDAIELSLFNNQGMLFASDKDALAEKFPEYAAKIEALTENDCAMHFNFHQRISRAPQLKCKTTETSEKKVKDGASLADDIGKDEAAVLYEVLNAQAATFTLLNNRIANQIKDAEKEDNTKMLIHPGTIQFYKETADSIRATVKAIGELNVALNGQKDSSLDGLLALAQALNSSRANATPSVKTHPKDNPEDGTTTMFDD